MQIHGFRDFLLELEKSDIRYVLLRKDLLSDAPIKDLDVLIDPRQFTDFKRITYAKGFFLIKDGYLNPGKKVFIRPCGTGSLLIDLHLEVVHRGLVFHDVRICLERRQKRRGLFFLSDEDYLIALLFHNLLAKNRIQEKHAGDLRELLQKSLDEAYLQQQLHRFGLWAVFEAVRKDFELCVQDADFVAPLAQRARQSLEATVPANRRRRRLIHRRRKWARFFGRKRGLVIAFIGPDGAGKSTTISAIQEYLNRLGLNTHVAYLGPWGGSLFHFKNRLKWLNVDPYREDYKAYYAGKLQQKPSPLPLLKQLKLAVRSAMYYPLLMIEMAARWYVRVLPRLREGRVVLADRYIYDMLVGYKSRPMDYQVGVRRWLCRLYPRPDFGVLLDADPEVIYARKPQLRASHLTLIRPLYRQVANQYGFVILDTGTSVEATVQAFAERLTPDMLKRLQAKLD
ncbi:MAG: hypothetical protein Q9P14_00680 [candidate division KSB1 bacterium]|nr:hypothetical protein [candidate division KSB1 bacterium]MDQ7066352.1 hypothetical protein [candidate division KSB1 bacterium]